MPNFVLKGTGQPPKEMVNYLHENAQETLYVTIEIESTQERLRRSFHALIRAWFESGEWSANGEKIKTYEALRNYYKLEGCGGIPEWYRFGNYNTKNIEEITRHLPNEYTGFIVKDPKSWNDMTKKEKRLALETLLTEIRYSMTNNKKVLEWVAKITGDIDIMRDLGMIK